MGGGAAHRHPVVLQVVDVCQESGDSSPGEGIFYENGGRPRTCGENAPRRASKASVSPPSGETILSQTPRADTERRADLPENLGDFRPCPSSVGAQKCQILPDSARSGRNFDQHASFSDNIERMPADSAPASLHGRAQQRNSPPAASCRPVQKLIPSFQRTHLYNLHITTTVTLISTCRQTA